MSRKTVIRKVSAAVYSVCPRDLCSVHGTQCLDSGQTTDKLCAYLDSESAVFDVFERVVPDKLNTVQQVPQKQNSIKPNLRPSPSLVLFTYLFISFFPSLSLSLSLTAFFFFVFFLPFYLLLLQLLQLLDSSIPPHFPLGSQIKFCPDTHTIIVVSFN